MTGIGNEEGREILIPNPGQLFDQVLREITLGMLQLIYLALFTGDIQSKRRHIFTNSIIDLPEQFWSFLRHKYEELIHTW